MRTSQKVEIVKLFRGKVCRVVYGQKQLTHLRHGFILIEGMYMRVVLKDGEWREHQVDWRFYETITDARRHDQEYDKPWIEGHSEYVQGIGVM